MRIRYLAAVLLAATVLGGAAIAGPHGHGMGGPPNVEALESELGITPDQKAAWDVYAEVLKRNATSAQAMRQGVDPRAMTPEDRAAFMTKMMGVRQQHFELVKAAAEALLPSLNEFQKGKASAMLPGLRSGMPGMMGCRGRT
ncbi:MAG: Spy/CpxP family protein refolding chaperone [Alphaproteobacteria bacterium]|nr:Spy/CpxP family protein refolding chaperone [Alphaproteobacteria bacterium]